MPEWYYLRRVARGDRYSRLHRAPAPQAAAAPRLDASTEAPPRRGLMSFEPGDLVPHGDIAPDDWPDHGFDDEAPPYRRRNEKDEYPAQRHRPLADNHA
jgi:hypothetical protein